MLTTKESKEPLSRQEERVIALTINGLSDKEVARELDLGINTIRTYWERIRRKVGVNSRAEAIATYLSRDSQVEIEAQRVENEILLHEIVRRRKAEAELAASESWLRGILECSPLGIFVTDPDGDALFLNDAYCLITGLNREEAIGKGWVKAIHPEDRDRVFTQWYACCEEGTDFFSDQRYLRPDGVSVHVHVWSRPINRDGEILGYVGMVSDVTSSHEAKMELQVREASHRQLLDAMEHFVWKCDNAKNVVECNAYGLQYTGRTLEQLRTHGWTDLVHPEDLSGVIAAWQSAIESESPYRAKIRIKRAVDGQFRWHISKATPVRNGHGEVTGWVGTSTDVHDL